MAVRKPAARRCSEGESLYEAVETFLRAYQARDRDRPCYGNVSISECYGLEWIVRRGPLPVNDLAEALHLNKSGASRIAKSLEKKGYIRRQRQQRDRRSILLGATPSGRAHVDRIRAQIVARQDTALEGLPSSIRSSLPEALRRLAESVVVPHSSVSKRR